MGLPTVFIDGNTGTTGMQIGGRLQTRTDIHLLALPEEQRKDKKARSRCLNACDIAILCLPDDEARHAVLMIENPDVRVIDASSAHRTVLGWVYGMPEWDAARASQIATATRVSNPGCYALGAICLLRPLVAAGFIRPEAKISVTAVSGYTGGGKILTEPYDSKTAWDTVFADLTKAIEKNPQDATAYLHRSVSWRYSREYDKAIEDSNKAIQLNPDYVVAYNNRGIAWRHKGEPDKALEDFNKAVELDPQDVAAYDNRGNAWFDKGDYDKAIDNYTKAIELNPQEDNDNAKVYLNRGIAWNDKGEPDKAIEDFNKSIELSSLYAIDAHFNRGVAWKNKGNYDKALEVFNEMIGRRPGFAEAYTNRGDVWKAMGKKQEAHADFKRAKELKGVNQFLFKSDTSTSPFQVMG